MEDIKNILNRFKPITFIILCSPLIVYYLTLLLPTFDDWTYPTTPFYNSDGNFINRILPVNSYWRPWDGLFGYILNLNSSLFPALNHIVVYMAHLCSTILIYAIGGQLGFKKNARHIGMFFFFLSPGMLGTVLGIDSLNQAYSQMWGLMATWIYLNDKLKYRISLWLLCSNIAILAKENGIAFLLIPQIIALAFGKASLQQAIRDTMKGLIIIMAYFTLRIALNNNNVNIGKDYFDYSMMSNLKKLGLFFGMTWIATDYVSLVHPPSRNLILVIVTLLLSMPFTCVLFFRQRRFIITKQFLALALCMVIAAAPHLLTLFTVMHVYAGLSLAALIISFLADKFTSYTMLNRLFMLYIASCLFIDWHHWQKSYESGLTGKNMGEQAISKTGAPVNKVYNITIDDGTPRYSSFCVIPSDAFAWGLAAYAATGYKWPETVRDTTISVSQKSSVESIADAAIKAGYQKVWLVHGDTVDVIR